MKRLIQLSVVVVSALAVAAHAADAPRLAEYPTKPIRLIVPFATGGGTDIVSRVMAQKAGDIFKQAVVVDNRGGAGGVIGMEMSVRAAPDGYTLGIISGSIATTAACCKLPYDPIHDITPISMIAETGYLLTVNPSVPAKSVRELITYAKANPGRINYGSSGIGSTSHLAGEQFDVLAGTKMTHVPYKSSGPALTDLLGGQIQLVYGSMPLVVPQMSSNRLRVIAITTIKRNRALPEVPTIAESGLPEYETITWYGLMGPKGLPRAIVARWQAALAEAVKSREMKERLDLDGLEVPEIGSAYLLKTIERDIVKWTRVVKAGNLKLGN
jgi:tripartite-type tricarboxylate transporter receptor subunit TctC